jgi:hypothetical protein
MITRTANSPEVSGTVYAVASDFCRIFSDDMGGLYQLSLCLTADPAKAEQCFVSGLEDSRQSNRVFKEWARSWARRTIIQNAIRMMGPARKHAEQATRATASEVKTPGNNVPLAALLGLPTFERFVFVMSVLERFSDQDCKTLLGCSRQDIVRARIQAMKRMATFDQTRVPDVALGVGKLFMQRHLLPETA